MFFLPKDLVSNCLQQRARSTSPRLLAATNITFFFASSKTEIRRIPPCELWDANSPSCTGLPQDTCGLATDNYLGGSRQLNTTLRGGPKAWPRFFLENRLNFQASMAARSGLLGLSFMKRLSAATPRIEAKLATREPLSLLHGDLWSGNVLTDQNEAPWLIDPAVYIGHREADLAMTSLFGGFPAGFRRAYEEEYPLTDGWRAREPIYQLYHVLNHLNLFGRSYLAQAEALLNAI